MTEQEKIDGDGNWGDICSTADQWNMVYWVLVTLCSNVCYLRDALCLVLHTTHIQDLPHTCNHLQTPDCLNVVVQVYYILHN